MPFAQSDRTCYDSAMNNQHAWRTFWTKVGGYYLIPHELLHVLAYRLIGKPCHYEWGAYYVRPLSKRTKWERLFTSLFPFGVCMGLGLLFHLLWVLSAFFIRMPPERYFIDGPTWHIIFIILGPLFVLYSGTAHGDLINSYLILFGEDEPQDERPEPHRDAEDKPQERQ